MRNVKKMTLYIYTAMRGFVGLLFSAILLMLTAAVLLVRTELSPDYHEVFQLGGNGADFYAWVLLTGLAIVLYRKGKSNERGWSNACWFGVLAAVHMLIGLFLIFNVSDSYIRADVRKCFAAARNVLQGNYGDFAHPGYLDQCPHQLGLVSMFALLLPVCDSYSFFQLLYLVMELGVLFLLWKIGDMVLGPNTKASKVLIWLSFAFLPHLFGFLFLYNQLPSLLFLMLTLYAMLRFQRSGRLGWAGMAVVSLLLACVIRSNMLIAAIAMAAVWMMQLFKTGRKRCAVLAALLLMGSIAGTQGITQIYRYITGEPLNTPIPTTAYFAMGTQVGRKGNGCYNDYVVKVYESSTDQAQREETARRDLFNRLGYMRQNPRYALSFYGKKVLITWTEPTFQMLWSGPGISGGEDVNTALLKSLYGDGKVSEVFQTIMHAMLFWIYLLAGLYPVMALRKGHKESILELFCMIFFIGGFLFHILWETKSQYVLCYVLLLLPLTVRSLIWLMERKATPILQKGSSCQLWKKHV